MMLDEGELQKLAMLARLEFPHEELSGLGRDLQEIIAYMQELVAVHVPSVPLVEQTADLRADACHDDGTDAVNQASEKHEGWIRLPRVVP